MGILGHSLGDEVYTANRGYSDNHAWGVLFGSEEGFDGVLVLAGEGDMGEAWAIWVGERD